MCCREECESKEVVVAVCIGAGKGVQKIGAFKTSKFTRPVLWPEWLVFVLYSLSWCKHMANCRNFKL